MIYITGDTHGRFERVEAFCERFRTKREDVLIILGDAGINFSGGMRDSLKKRFLEELPITLFCIHGNHEQRPGTIDTYKEMIWRGGAVNFASAEIKAYVERKSDKLGCKVDKSTEIWLDGIEDSLITRNKAELQEREKRYTIWLKIELLQFKMYPLLFRRRK